MRIPVYKRVILLLTNKCNNYCSFCYRKELMSKPEVQEDMTEDMALKIMDFILDRLPVADNFMILFWGGEPLVRFNVIKRVVSEYPQLWYHINSNGKAVDKKTAQFLEGINSLSFVWSLGDAYEKYGSVEAKVRAQHITADLVRRREFAVNLLVTKYDRVYEDFKFIYENITPKIGLDLPMKFDHMTEQDMEAFAEGFSKILISYDDGRFDAKNNVYTNVARTSDLWYEAFGLDDLVRPWKFCECGLERILIDPKGVIWQCDGSYINQINRFGDIENGIDWKKLDYLWELHDKPWLMNQGCECCELEGRCVKNKCMGDNYQVTGSIFKPDPVFCQGCKAMARGIKKYINFKKKGLAYAASVK